MTTIKKVILLKETKFLLLEYLVQDITQVVLQYSTIDTQKCQVHGYHLSKFCLHTDCLNKRIHSGPSYVFLQSFQVHICQYCSIASLVISDPIDKIYVKEVNKYLYFDLGPKNYEYYRLTRCEKCEDKENVLYIQNNTRGPWSSNPPQLNLVTMVDIHCYDYRWYIVIYQQQGT